MSNKAQGIYFLLLVAHLNLFAKENPNPLRGVL